MANGTTSVTGLRLGTRASALALAQAGLVRDALAAADPLLAVEIVTVRTTGDRVQDRPLRELGGKGLFTKELDAALIDGRIDIAVHSMKDVETKLADGLAIDCLLAREDPRDALFVRPGIDATGLADLPAGARVGTSSLRRAALVLAARPDLEIVPLRGNVETRLAKLAAGEADATLLAVAGLNRLGRAGDIEIVLTPEEMLPAVGQGAVGIARRAGDEAVAALLAPLNHAATWTCVAAERAMLAALDGSCHTPVGGLAEIDGDMLTLRALLAAPDGTRIYRADRTGGLDQARTLGRAAGEELREAAGEAFFAALADN